MPLPVNVAMSCAVPSVAVSIQGVIGVGSYESFVSFTTWDEPKIPTSPHSLLGDRT